MKQYYFTDGKKKFGPFNLDEFKTKKISQDTLIWHEGLDTWVAAKEVQEVNEFIKTTSPPPIEETANSKETTLPPPIDKISNTQKTTSPPHVKNIKKENKQPNSKKDSKIALYIISAIIFIILLSIVVSVVNKNNKKSKSYPKSNYNTERSKSNYKSNSKKSEVELKNELGRREINNPLNYLSVTFKIKNKILSGKTIIKGRIYSSAKMATYKDVVLKLYYYTGTNTLISTEKFVIYQKVYTQYSTEYLIETKVPNRTKKIDVKVVSAKHYK